jgi:phosphopantothenoylcysteine decarboxylase / phosphopantothenate---cysteine ligase
MSSPSILTGKRIVLGVTGSIAAYKSAYLASQLTQHGARVDVVMTESAQKFVTPLTFQALTGRPVYTSLWQTDTSGGLPMHIAHVGLAQGADLLLIAPITANTLAKLALGLADNLLTVTALAARCPVLIAPAMDAGMYDNPATQAHVETLRARGVQVAGPAMGRMASGLEGLGRMIEPEEIVGACRRVLGLAGPLQGRRVVVTAGPTREALDPVRYLTNYSSGKQGFAIAQAALEAGADVTLISGPVDAALPTPVGAERLDVTDTRALRDAVITQASGDHPADALIMAAAVADFRPAETAAHKIKKSAGVIGEPPAPIELAENPDILAEVAAQPKRPRLTVGFAAESENLATNAQAKLARKKLDLIVANDITAHDAGFAADTNRVLFITPGGVEELPLMTKAEVAARIVAWVAERLNP